MAKLAALAVVIIVLLQGPVALAVPIAEWTGPWQVNFFEDATGLTSIARFFGQTGPDGFEPLPGTPALAKSSTFSLGLSFPPFSLASATSSRVNFQRSFQLRDSPAGWAVSLDGELEGTLFSTGGDLSSANVSASARISSPSEPDLARILLPLGFPPGFPPGNGTVFSPGFKNVSELSHVGFDLQDGIYTVNGSLLAFVISNPGLPGAVSSLSDFFRDGFSVSVSARPVLELTPLLVPETTPLLLFGSTMAGLLVAARWRQRKQS